MNINNSTTLILVILVFFLASSCNAQKRALEIDEKIERLEFQKSEENKKRGYVFLTDYSNFSLSENAERMVDSLWSRGIDSILVYKFGDECHRCSYQGFYIVFDIDKVSFFYEFKKEGAFRSVNCVPTTDIKLFFKEKMKEGEHLIHDPVESNQYDYQDLIFFVSGKKHSSISSRNDSYPDNGCGKFYDTLNKSILRCFYLSRGELTRLKLSD